MTGERVSGGALSLCLGFGLNRFGAVGEDEKAPRRYVLGLVCSCGELRLFGECCE